MFARWPRPLFYVVMASAIALDQMTKMWVTATFQLRESMPLLPGFFNLTYWRNTGVAFGMFEGEGLVVTLFVVALALAALYFVRGINWAAWEPNIVGGCLCGGALGNLVDRVRFGSVVDFFDVYLGTYHWPIFNVADSLICLSVGWIVLRQLTSSK